MKTIKNILRSQHINVRVINIFNLVCFANHAIFMLLWSKVAILKWDVLLLFLFHCPGMNAMMRKHNKFILLNQMPYKHALTQRLMWVLFLNVILKSWLEIQHMFDSFVYRFIPSSNFWFFLKFLIYFVKLVFFPSSNGEIDFNWWPEKKHRNMYWKDRISGHLLVVF